MYPEKLQGFAGIFSNKMVNSLHSHRTQETVTFSSRWQARDFLFVEINFIGKKKRKDYKENQESAAKINSM